MTWKQLYPALLLLPAVGILAAPPAKVTFAKVKPLLDKKCGNCHGARAHFGRLDLSTYELTMKGGFSGKIVLAKKPADSLIMKRIKGTIKPQMPKMAPPLTPQETKLVSDWIASGAKK